MNDIKKVNGIFWELERWLGSTDKNKVFTKAEPLGVLQIGNFTTEFMSRFSDAGFKNINYIDETEMSTLRDKSKLFSVVGQNILNYDTIFINTGDDGYEIVSSGIPANVKTVIIRYVKSNVQIETLLSFMGYLGFYLAFEAVHKGDEVTDLLFKK